MILEYVLVSSKIASWETELRGKVKFYLQPRDLVYLLKSNDKIFGSIEVLYGLWVLYWL